MIKLGRNRVPFYPNDGIKIFLFGNITFKGVCDIGNNSTISISKNGNLIVGENFSATASLKLTCSKEIVFHDSVTVGWDCIFMDSDFHRLTKVNGGYTKGIGTIEIGSNNWFCSRNMILKNTRTPNYCTISAQSVLNKDYTSFGEYNVIGSDKKINIISKNKFLDLNDPYSAIKDV